MLGATHACANPLTARYGTTHGMAIAVMLPHVVRWNSGHVADRYRHLIRAAKSTAGVDRHVAAGRSRSSARPGSKGVEDDDAGEQFAARLDELRRAGGLPGTLRELGVPRNALSALASDAATQWTGTFNPRLFDADGALSLYERAY